MSAFKLIALWVMCLTALGGWTFYVTRPPKEVVCACDRCLVMQSGGAMDADTTLALGSALPELKGNWLTAGKPRPEFSGRVTLIDFWGIACLPCRMAIPANNSIYAKYQPQGLNFVGVSIDPVAALLDYKESVQMDYPLFSAGESTFKAFGVQFTPSAFLFDKKGKLIWKGGLLEKKDGTLVDSFSAALNTALNQ